jgi:O-antigen/teichoic acid export membrane protein
MRNALASWKAPQHRDGLALVLSSAVTSGIGLLYWVVAARLFDPETVGVNSTMTSTLTLLGSAAQLNLGNALLRFVPTVGNSARSLVVKCYAVSIAAACLTGAVFALGSQLWAPELLDAVGSAPLFAFFVLATPVWSIWVMQDYALTAIKRATLVPVKNLVFAVLKIILLPVGAALSMFTAISVSWAAATGVLVVVVSVWLWRALPAHGTATADNAEAFQARTIVGFVSADWAGTLFSLAVNFGLPLLVLARLGADAAATFGVAWAIAFALYLVSNGMGQSLLAHVSADPEGLDAAYRGMVRKALTLIVPAVIVIVPAAGLILSIFGEHYADTGTMLLTLSALSAIPNVVSIATVNAARVRQHRIIQFGVPAVIAVIVIPLSWILMPLMGLTGVGVALLVGQTIVAAVILITRWLRPRRSSGVPSGPAPVLDPAMADVATSPIPIVTGGLPAYGMATSPGESPVPGAQGDPSSSISAATQPIPRPPHSTRD